jgi:hypothetical protein
MFLGKLVRRKMKIENGKLKIESTMTMAFDDDGD